MQNRENSIKEIINYFGRIRQQLLLRNSIQLFDINIFSEQFFKDLLNMIYGYQLANLNNNYSLTESIDLADSKLGIAFQVTSNRTKKKIAITVQSFYDNGTFKDYPILKILLLGDKPKRKGLIIIDEFKFDLEKDVIDFSDLIKSINSLETERVIGIEQWMKSELTNDKTGSYMPPSQSDFDKYFLKFLNTDIDIETLLFNSQPSLADCREIFSDEYYYMIHQLYSTFYFSMLDRGTSVKNSLRDKDDYHAVGSTLKEIKDNNHDLPGGVRTMIEKNAFRSSKYQYYSIKFTQRGETFGTSFKIWVFLNGRWVFFPKPWELVRAIHEIKNHRVLRSLIYLMKFFGFRIEAVEKPGGVLISSILINELGKK